MVDRMILTFGEYVGGGEIDVDRATGMTALPGPDLVRSGTGALPAGAECRRYQAHFIRKQSSHKRTQA